MDNLEEIEIKIGSELEVNSELKQGNKFTDSTDGAKIACVTCFFRINYTDFIMSCDFFKCNICNKTLCSTNDNCCYSCSFKLLKCYSCGDKISNYHYELFKLDKYVSEYINNLKQKMYKIDDKTVCEKKIDIAIKAYCQMMEFFWTNTKIINITILALPNLQEFIENTKFTKEEVENYTTIIRKSKINRFKNYVYSTGYGLNYIASMYDFLFE